MSDFRFRETLRRLTPVQLSAYLAQLTEEETLAALEDWPSWAHEGQDAPPGDWRTWVIMAGRGFGKTRAGAEWIARRARDDGTLRIALVAASFDEARAVMVEGTSGLLDVAADDIAGWSPTRRLLRFASGAEARLYSAARPAKLRGPEHHIAWCDELAKWKHGVEAWDMLQLGLRLGPNPQALVTTTPAPCEALRRILAGPHELTIGRTHDNPHLPPAFVEAVTSLYAGTRLARQEIDGELLPDVAGALWTVELLERCRTLPLPPAREGRGEGQSAPARAAPPSPHTLPTPLIPSDPKGGDSQLEGRIAPFARTVIAVDPPSGTGTCGIIACAKDAAGIAHVLADHSVTDRSPEGWATAVAAAAEAHGATLVVAEANQGGKMVQAVLHAANVGVRVKLVHATQGKSARADPIATLFEAGKVRLAGRFRELEAELCGFIAGGGYEGPGTSPDRADAMVWGLTELMLGERERRVGMRVV